jgi:sugar phosphate isomerase/epimerase
MLALNSDFNGESTDPLSVRGTIHAIAEAGFTHVHWVHEWNSDYTYAPAEMRQIATWLREAGLAAKGVHASAGVEHAPETEASARVDPTTGLPGGWPDRRRRDFASFDDDAREAGVDLVRNRVDLAAALGTREIVLHVLVPHRSFAASAPFRDRYMDRLLLSFGELEAHCRDRGVTICAENMLQTPNPIQFEEFDTLFDAFAPDFLGLCYDTGHGFSSDMARPLAIPTRYAERLRAVHLSDHTGEQDPALAGTPMAGRDGHRVPGEGVLPWVEIVATIAATPLQPPLVLEVEAGGEPDLPAFLARSHAAGRRLAEAFTAARADAAIGTDPTRSPASSTSPDGPPL